MKLTVTFFMLLFSLFYSAQTVATKDLSLLVEKEIFIYVPNNVLNITIPIPPASLPVTSEIKFTSSSENIKATYSYDILWPKTKHSKAKYIRLLNVSFPSIRETEKIKLEFSSSIKDITESSFSQKIRGKLTYPNEDWLKETLLLINHQDSSLYKVDDFWYREIQRLKSEYLTNSTLMYKNKYPPNVGSQWLFDRAQAIYQLYLSTGNEKWKREGDKIVQFYKEHINDAGFFDLAKPKDIKYLMGRSLVYDYLLNQHYTSIATLKKLFQASLNWEASYSSLQGFWTERHFSAALNVALSYWEVSSDIKAKQRIDELIESIYKMTFYPASNWPVRKCPQHTFHSHEGWGDRTPACSPWMMALIAENLWRYYLLTEDKSSSALLIAFAEFITKDGTYIAKERKLKGLTIPKYIVSLENPLQEEHDPWVDRLHVCDVATMVAKGVYIKHFIYKENINKEMDTFEKLAYHCKHQHESLLEAFKYNKPKYIRVRPPRKFGWQYSSTNDLPWLMSTLNMLNLNKEAIH